MTDETIPDVVARLKRLTMRDRTGAMQRLIGPLTHDTRVLNWRALLVTALREAKVWPVRDGL